jgi:mono/diheme cytochrome c family protein
MMMKHRSSAFLLVTLLVLSTSLVSFAQDAVSKEPADITAGAALFKANCKTCHAVDRKLIGPALQGVTSRAPSIQWIKDWVHNSSKVIASGDSYGTNLFAEYKSQMTAFTNLTDAQIMQILAYVEAPVQQETKTPPNPNEPKEPGIPAAYLDAIFIGMAIILVLLLATLIIVARVLKNTLNQRKLDEVDEQIVNSPYTFGTIVRSSGFAFIVVFIVSAIAFKTIIDGLYSIGVQKGYQPRQPIAFSHKIHAGQFEIDCKYCHTGVMKAKNANIPSPNICMNCHSQIRQGTLPNSEAEIKKIYTAVGYDPDKGEYTGVTKPIQWIRVHNLPDLAYFNHSQHVNVGGVQCETCHGPIKEMEVVKQYSLLTMGWCINCHRQTDVATKGNAYYDKLMELHDPGNRGKKIKVEAIGGLECGKCHY